MPRRKPRMISLACPHCDAGLIGPSDVPPPLICYYCGKRVREWIIESDDDEDFEEKENPEGTYYDDGTIEF
jgi:hypothetical protein